MAAMAFMPARKSSVFLAGLPSLAARIFSPSNTAYSTLGKVKLSLTIFGFLSLVGFVGAAVTTDFGAAVVRDLVTALAFGLASTAAFLVLGVALSETFGAALAGAFATAMFVERGLVAALALSISVMHFLSDKTVYTVYMVMKKSSIFKIFSIH